MLAWTIGAMSAGLFMGLVGLAALYLQHRHDKRRKNRDG